MRLDRYIPASNANLLYAFDERSDYSFALVSCSCLIILKQTEHGSGGASTGDLLIMLVRVACIQRLCVGAGLRGEASDG